MDHLIQVAGLGSPSCTLLALELHKMKPDPLLVVHRPCLVPPLPNRAPQEHPFIIHVLENPPFRVCFWES